MIETYVTKANFIKHDSSAWTPNSNKTSSSCNNSNSYNSGSSSNSSISNIITNIINNIERFEPRIKLQKLEITPNIDDQEYICDFIYTIPRFNNEQLNLKGRLSSSGFYV